ncbi:hypothetical protein GGS21DRAFT_488878 [Xylaria nigripes]|nr:hypothetical protein GGS21DRAFT_488878 [Xylaria nigripes]
MVGFVERFRKPKLPIVLGSPEKDSVEHQVYQVRDPIPRPQKIATPVLRNFSYPTSVTNTNPPPSTSPALKESPSTWDQLGEICSFSVGFDFQARQARAAGLEDPFFYSTDRTSCKQLVNGEGPFITDPEAQQFIDSGPIPQIKGPEKRQRRSKNFERTGLQERGKTRHSRGHSIGDHIFYQKSNLTAKLKRSSIGHRKSSSLFDTTRLLARRPANIERPMSSSGVPLIDTRFAHVVNTTVEPCFSPSFLVGFAVDDSSSDQEKDNTIVLNPKGTEIGMAKSRDSVQNMHGAAPSITGLADGHSYKGRAMGSPTHGQREGKSRWFFQLKEWVSVTEPSTQALKDFKKDTYKRAGIALDDPMANAKLHLPVASLPPNVIKPGGRGPEPEEIARQRAMQRKKTPELMLPLGGTSQTSHSTTSHYSSSSSISMSMPRDDV